MNRPEQAHPRVAVRAAVRVVVVPAHRAAQRLALLDVLVDVRRGSPPGLDQLAHRLAVVHRPPSGGRGCGSSACPPRDPVVERHARRRARRPADRRPGERAAERPHQRALAAHQRHVGLRRSGSRMLGLASAPASAAAACANVAASAAGRRRPTRSSGASDRGRGRRARAARAPRGGISDAPSLHLQRALHARVHRAEEVVACPA